MILSSTGVIERLEDQMTRVIAECGFAVQAVGAGEDASPFAYTVGLAGRGLPEVTVCGYDLSVSHRMLNLVGAALLCGALPAGETPVRFDFPDVRGVSWLLPARPELARTHLLAAARRAPQGFEVRALALENVEGDAVWELTRAQRRTLPRDLFTWPAELEAALPKGGSKPRPTRLEATDALLARGREALRGGPVH